MKILIVDEDENAVAPLIDELKANEYEIKRITFSDFKNQLDVFAPNIIVLDLMDTLQDLDGGAGRKIFKFIWEERYYPVIIYSANPNLLDCDEHPFVRKVKKGRHSVEKVIEAIGIFSPVITSVEKTKTDILSFVNIVLRDSAKNIFNASGKTFSPDAILRALKRRIAASFDQPLDEESLKPWEQYIIPPLGECFIQGDIIFHRETKEHYIVLTPSCDMVENATRHPKIESILCAKYKKYTEVKDKLGIPSLDSERSREKLLKILRYGRKENYIPLPPFPDVIDIMFIDTRDLNLIKYSDAKEQYERLLSIDSPFRENISWMFLSDFGKHGLPDRNFENIFASKYKKL